MDEMTMGNQCELSNRPIEVITQEIQFYKGQATMAIKVSQAEQVAAQKEQEIKDLQKKLAIAGDSKIAIFKVHFEGVQGQLNKMLLCIEELNQEESADAAKLRAALKKLCEGVLEELGE